MNRKKFIESLGATCRNWTWSWSFVNHQKKFVIFGVWDQKISEGKELILAEEWEKSALGRKQPGYSQAREHIKLVESEGYTLQTFPIIHSDGYKDENGVGPSKIGEFKPVVTPKLLQRVGGKWYASDEELNSLLPEEVWSPELYIEGASMTVSVNAYERSRNARDACIAHHGYSCVVCQFNFEKFYGSIGHQYIHVHHIVPLSKIGRQYKVNPVEDLVPVCPNCHAMIHSKKTELSIDQLRYYLKNNKSFQEKEKAK